jgi:type II secretory pathway component GspD/PulD (secretin)
MRNRICLALVWLCTLAGAFQPAHSQARAGSLLERKVTVTFSQAPLESVLRTLRRQYGVRISYSNTVLDLRQPVTLSVQNQPLRTVLNTVLANKKHWLRAGWRPGSAARSKTSQAQTGFG